MIYSSFEASADISAAAITHRRAKDGTFEWAIKSYREHQDFKDD
jgi:hypothetical protein